MFFFWKILFIFLFFLGGRERLTALLLQKKMKKKIPDKGKLFSLASLGSPSSLYLPLSLSLSFFLSLSSLFTETIEYTPYLQSLTSVNTTFSSSFPTQINTYKYKQRLTNANKHKYKQTQTKRIQTNTNKHKYKQTQTQTQTNTNKHKKQHSSCQKKNAKIIFYRLQIQPALTWTQIR